MITPAAMATRSTAPILQGFAKWRPLDVAVLALTPVERWQAAGRLSSNFMTERWFIITSLAAIIVLTMLLVVVSLRRKWEEQKGSNQSFEDYAAARGLTAREREILLEIANITKLKRSEAIFTIDRAFDRGAAQMVEESLAEQGVEKRNQLRSELSFLREKLGFQKQRVLSIGSPSKSKKLSSRQIPVGKKLYLTRRKPPDSGNVESIVIRNDDMELTVRLTMSIKIAAGELWCARYYFGASVWEFDTSAISCDDNTLVLNHADNVRFINRRRFLRVPVKKAAFVAPFPFTKRLSGDSESVDGTSGGWKPPEFVPAIVTELAGPGLRIEAPLEAQVGDRVLVIFKLEEEKSQDTIPVGRDNKGARARIIEDIGEVRRITALRNGWSIAVELIGLSDSDVNELIRVTNEASLKARAKGQEVPALANGEEVVPEPAAIRGV